jgi:prophage regulatory protein
MPKQILRLSQVCELTGLARSTVYLRLETDPSFPRPIRLGDAPNSAIGFYSDELSRWLRKRPRTSPGPETTDAVA